MPSYRLLAPVALLALLFLYLAWEVDASWSKWLIPCLVLAALIYVLGPQINWWWWRRNLPDLQPDLRPMLERFEQSLYPTLSPDEQRRFRSRVFLHRESIEWTPMAWPDEEIPEDVKLAIAAQAAVLTFKREDFLLSKFEKVVVYPKPFMSPEFPFPHASELFEPDGCLIFSAEQVMNGVVKPRQWFNVALYEHARAVQRQWPNLEWQVFQDDAATWEKLEAVSGMPRAFIETVVGLTGVEPFGVAVHHFFVHRKRFQAVFPEAFLALEKVF